MLRELKYCPCCHDSHGHSGWRVVNCSVFFPLRCGACGRFFYWRGQGAWDWVLMFAPIPLLKNVLLLLLSGGVFWGEEGGWVNGLAWVLSGVLVWLLVTAYVTWRYPLMVSALPPQVK